MAANTSNGNVVTLVDANAKNVKTLDLTKEEMEAIVKEALEGKDVKSKKGGLIQQYLTMV